MEFKFVSLIVHLTRLSEKLKSVTFDLDKIAALLQDPQILAITGLKDTGVLSPEDYD